MHLDPLRFESLCSRIHPMTNPKWTQDEAIAFECARECVTDLMGICSTAIADEQAEMPPNAARLAELENELVELARERAAMTVSDRERIAVIRRVYGARVLAHRAEHRQ